MPVLNLTSTNEIRINNNAALDRCILSMADGNSSALAELYGYTNVAVYSFALSILKNSHDAEDVLHDCYLSIHSSAGTYRSAGKPMAWILTITRNLCLLKLRDRRKTADEPVEDWENYSVQREEFSPEDRLVLMQCMTQLADEERQIVILHAVAGFKHREIADITGLSLPTVLSKYHRALKKLKKFIDYKGEEY